jgi:uncharacterized protein (DUF2164 family)
VSNEYLKKIVNAYAPVGIPLILIVNVPFQNDKGQDEYDLHAIVVSGHKMVKPKLISPGNTTSWMSDNIEKIYAHDDQYGPFVRIDLKDKCELITEWTIDDKHNRSTFVSNVVVPLYPKIRIAYDDIEKLVFGLDTLLTLFFDKQIRADLVWDVRIVLSENYKTEIKSIDSFPTKQKLNILTQSMPKHIWVASCYIGQYKLIDFVFDATGINSAMLGTNIISYLPNEINKDLIKFLKTQEVLIKDLLGYDYYLKYIMKYLAIYGPGQKI